MDRVVWLIIVTVVTHVMLEYSGALAQTPPHVRTHGSVAAQYQLPSRVANSAIPNDVELINPARTPGPVNNANDVNNGRSARIQLLDNIFRVSELRPVQATAGCPIC